MATERALLLAGIAAGLLFFIVPTIAIFSRPGFDIRRHAISMLSLGEGGWIMKAVFALCGLLTLACARGIHLQAGHELAGLIAAILIGAYGAGLILAGVFDAPAGLGFPPGTPQDHEPVMTVGPILHGVAFMLAFGSLIAPCFVFAWFFLQAQQPGWAAISLATGLALPTLIALGTSMKIPPGIAFYWAAMVGWLWLAAAVSVLVQEAI